MRQFEECVIDELRKVGLSHAAICDAAEVACCLTREFALPFEPRSAVFVALPYGGGPGRVARYARGRDYHRVLPELLDRAAEALAQEFPGLEYRCYADVSPYREVEAAERAGLGLRLRNRLLSVEGCGTYCLIGEAVFNLPVNRPLRSGEGAENPCKNCGRCVAACPSGALEHGFSHCLSGVTQTRKTLTPAEEQLIRSGGSIWGCDVCQQVCPLNLERPGESDPDLSELQTLSDRQFRKKYADRAFSYRGILPLRRNIALIEEEDRMREIKKSEKLQDVRYEIRGAVADLASHMEREGESIIKLNIGNLAPYGFDAPSEVIGDMLLNLRNAQGYTESKGIFAARKAIMQYYQLQNLPNLDIDDIYLGNGSSEMIIMSMQALLNPGDEMLVPSPDYPLWTAAVTLAGGRAVHYLCDEENEFNPSIEDMRAKITEHTKGIILINPNNPTGAFYSREVLQKVVDLAREFDLMLFSDEIYDHLIMDGEEFCSTASLAPDLFCATLGGVSKSHRVTGFRSGWIVFSGDRKRGKDYLEGMNLMASMRLCSNAPAQYIIQTCIGGYQSVKEFIAPGGRLYEQREFTYKMLCDIPGVSVVKPKAAFYIFPKYDKERFDFETDEQMALALLREEKILVVPGSGFNFPGNDHFRMTYLPEVSTLKVVKERMTRFFARHER